MSSPNKKRAGRPKLTPEEKALTTEERKALRELQKEQAELDKEARKAEILEAKRRVKEEKELKAYENKMNRRGSFLTDKDREELVKRKDANTLARQSNAAIVNQMMTELLEHPKTPKVINKIMQAALDDDHKGQTTAWKIIADRVLPTSYFENDKDGNAKSAISITITGVGTETEIKNDDAIDGEYTEN